MNLDADVLSVERMLEKRKIVRLFADGGSMICEDEITKEQRIVLVVDGRVELVSIISPGEEELCALGNLLARGLISGMADVESVNVSDCSVEVCRRVKIGGCHREPRFVRAEDFASSEGELPVVKLSVLWKTSFEAVMGGIAWIGEAPLFARTGSVHAAALITPTGERLFMTEDVGRHNAIDKATGWLVKNGVCASSVMLISSGRLPKDMVQKGARAGIPLMASVSAATAQGTEEALRVGMTLIGFARGKRLNIYSVPERIV